MKKPYGQTIVRLFCIVLIKDFQNQRLIDNHLIADYK